MTQAGRPRRSEEQPDSEFGKALKRHIRSVENFTQAELSREGDVAEKTISKMVKGERDRGYALRNDLRKIIKALYHRKALLTLDEANALMRTIPATRDLDKRDPEDKRIIDLFEPTEDEEEQFAIPNDEEPVSPDDEEVADAPVPVSSTSQDDVAASDTDIEPEPVSTPLPVTPLPVTALQEPVNSNTHKRLWYGSSGLALLVILGIVLFITHQSQSTIHQSAAKQTNSCSAPVTGVTLYTDINYKGQCHTFGPGDYELAQYGLEQNVSSIKDWNDAYFVKIYDTGKNFYDLDKSIAALPAEWDNRADMLHIEKHRPTTCHPGTNGIIAYINVGYAGGCLFITGSIPDLTTLNFDGDIVSIQFVGSYRNTMQLVIYKQPNYKERCGTYWQNQSDLEQCARVALSMQVLPFTPSTPVSVVTGTHCAGNVALQTTLSSGNTWVYV